ncbi:hypothetical protein ACFC0K_36190 [Streptomyces hydrogenans]|uniref:hypothetical protein n=1 Tax=Streptomyces hydrogenans TaxID=1873719 RepID=UPI0035D9FA59
MDQQTFTAMGGELVRAGLDSWSKGARHFAVLHTGMGCEHLLKAVLCSYNPLYISEKGDWAHMFHSQGFGDEPGVKPLGEARSIGIVEAFNRTSVLMRGRMSVTEKAFRPVAAARNGVAHLAYHDDQSAGAVVDIALVVAELLRAELGLDPAEFWGDYESLFTDLEQVAAMPAPAPVRDLLDAEAAAENRTRDLRAATYELLTTAMVTAAETASWQVATRTPKAQADLARVARTASLVTALRAAGAQSRQAATEILMDAQVLPFPSRPDASHAVPGLDRKAGTSVAVKMMIASASVSALYDFADKHPEVIARDVMWAVETVWGAEADSDSWWHECPACGSAGAVRGELVEVECGCLSEISECVHTGNVLRVGIPESFCCPMCALSLTHGEELRAAGFYTIEL